jgi:hypothetical protein
MQFNHYLHLFFRNHRHLTDIELLHSPYLSKFLSNYMHNQTIVVLEVVETVVLAQEEEQQQV